MMVMVRLVVTVPVPLLMMLQRSEEQQALLRKVLVKPKFMEPLTHCSADMQVFMFTSVFLSPGNKPNET